MPSPFVEYLTIHVSVSHPNGDRASYNGNMTGFVRWLMDCGVIKQEKIEADFLAPNGKEVVHLNMVEWERLNEKGNDDN